MNIMKTLALSAVMAISAISASAATLIYETGGSAFVELPLADGSFGDFFDDGLDDLDIAVSGQFSGGIVTLDLLVSDTSGILLESSSVLDATLEAAGGATVVFGSLNGSDSGLFGDTATVIFSFSATDELDGFIEPVTAQIFSDLAAVPLPATLPLLGFAVAGIIATGRRRAA